MENNNIVFGLFERSKQAYNNKNYDDMILILEEINNIDGLSEEHQSKSNYYLGKYYFTIKNYDMMKKYLLKSNNAKSLNILGNYHLYTEINYTLGKKYLMMATKQNYSKAYTSLGLYYDIIEKNHNEMKKCYLNATDISKPDYIIDSEAYVYLGFYYNSIIKDNNTSLKY